MANESQRTSVNALETRLQYETSLRRITEKIYSSALDDILLSVRDDLSKLIGCQRVTIYAKDPLRNEIFSKIKDGEDVREIRLPIDGSSIAGYVAMTRKTLRINDVYDAAQLSKIDPNLRFDSSWDQKSGFRSRQMIVVPIEKDGKLYGVIQVLNRLNGTPFEAEDENRVQELARSLAIAFQNQYRSGIRSSRYDTLLLEQIITPETLDKAQVYAQKHRCSMDWALIVHCKIPRAELERSLSEFFRCQFVPFDENKLPPLDLLEGWSLDVLKHHGFVPYEKQGDKVVVLMENPKNVLLRDDLQRRYPNGIIVKVSFREDIHQYIDLFFGQKQEEAKVEHKAIDEIIKKIEEEEAETQQAQEEEVVEVREDDSGIVLLVNQIIEQAYARGASDIHIEPSPDGDATVRLRIDGVCRQMDSIPKKFARAVVQRIKIMGGLDIAERRLPQDGKIPFKKFGGRDIELRVATLPTQGGMEDVVMRILASSKPLPLDSLGMHPDTLQRFKKAIEEPYGIILCVGPTGSGKTTTLHSALGHLNSPDWKIWTAEDPVEITQKGLRQVQVHPKIGFTFERALRAFLRADPDIIMIGEMRDAETASAAIEASLTGHLVFSTLHTNSAPETITRLLDLGLDPFAFGDALVAVLAQRLVRKICQDCGQRYVPGAQEWAAIRAEYGDDAAFDALPFRPNNVRMLRAQGCDRCNNTGYKGRMGVHELLIVDDQIRSLIYRKAQSSEIRDAAVKKGMILLKQDGIQKALLGFTDLKEVRSVCAK